MGYDCNNYLPKGTKISDVREFLELLGFEKLESRLFYYYDRKNYSSFSGVLIEIEQQNDRAIRTHLHTKIWCVRADIEKLNWTAKQINKRFGGTFISDNGKGRYISPSGPDIRAAEAGCYIAYSNFESNVKIAEIYLSSIKFGATFPPIGMIPEVDRANPLVLSNNLIVPFLVSVIEEYYKSSYVAILRFSDNEKKQSIFRNARVYSDELIRLSNGESSVEESIVRAMSFQNIDKITTYFKELDKGLDLAGILKKPFGRRKKSLYDSIREFFEQRHELIHRNVVLTDYSSERLKKDTNNIKAVAKLSYRLLIRRFNWLPAETMYSGIIK